MQKPFMEKALEQFDGVLEMEPDNPDALFASSILHYKFGYHKKTIERFEGLLKVGRELPGLDVIPEEDSHLRLNAHLTLATMLQSLQPSVSWRIISASTSQLSLRQKNWPTRPKRP